MPRRIYAGAATLTFIGIAILVVHTTNLSFSPHLANSSSKFSLTILSIQVFVVLVSVLASSVASATLWAQLSFASVSKSGLPLQALDRACQGSFSPMVSWSVGGWGQATSIPQLALRLLVPAWLGAAIIPQVGFVPWYTVPSISVTTMGDVAMSLQTNNCFIPNDFMGVNLASCNSPSWMISTLASISLGDLAVTGNTYRSGCNLNYPLNTLRGRSANCVQNFVAGITPLQRYVANGVEGHAVSASAFLPSYQINIHCDLKSEELLVDFEDNNKTIQELIWMTVGSDNSSFTLNMLGFPSVGSSNTLFIASCDVHIFSGIYLWMTDPSTVAIPSSAMNSSVVLNSIIPKPKNAESPALLLSQFSTLVSFANSTQIGYSWSPLLAAQHGGSFNSDPSPLGQILNGILAGLLNQINVDSKFIPSAVSVLFISASRIHFATGVTKGLCVAGALIVILSCLVIIYATWRISETGEKAPCTAVEAGRPSVWLMSRIVKRKTVSRLVIRGKEVHGSSKADRFVAKWRTYYERGHSASDTAAPQQAFVLIDACDHEDKCPLLHRGRRYVSRGDIWK